MAGFNLFESEEEALARARSLLAGLGEGESALKEGLSGLVEAYGRGIREQRRLVKVSDKLQAQLASLNGELARRRAEAEEALESLKAAQESLVQAEKLASLGALVAGVAHEINTPIGVALSCASHLSDQAAAMRRLFEADDIGVEDFERFLATLGDTTGLIQGNCERAADLIRSFKQVAVDRTTSERRAFDLKASLLETFASLGPHLRQAGHVVDIRCPEGITLNSYPGALSQVIGNLVMNSLLHAYEPGQAGLIALDAEQPDPAAVRIRYADDGRGIADEIRGRIFDPFFTTRRGAGGSGLGLHIVYNLVVGPLGGTVALSSEGSRGAVFVVTIPLDPP